MLAHRIIPTILSKGGHLVKGEGFSADRIVGNALQAARIHAMRSVDELVILDVGDRAPDYELVHLLTHKCFTPVTVGGGIKKIEQVQQLLNAGADKVCIPSLRKNLITEVSDTYGKQCVMASIDINCDFDDALEAIDVEEAGAGEILLQSIPRDGTMKGYDLQSIANVSSSVSVPVVASGGCSGYEDMANAICCGASAVAAGALFQFTEATPRGAAEYLSDYVEVRI